VTIDKESFERVRTEQKATEAAKSSKSFNAQLLKRESVRFGSLVGTPEWDSYLGYIQTVITQLEGVEQEARDLLENPKVIDHPTMIKAKMVLGESKASLGILNQIIKLPYAIVHEQASVSEIKSNIPLPELPDELKPKKSFWR